MTTTLPIAKRVSMALDLIRNRMPVASGPSARMPRGAKEAPFLWPTYQNGKPAWHIIDFESYATEGFTQNSLIYSAVMFKVRSIAQAPLTAYGGDMTNPKPLQSNAPLSMLAMHPNEHQSGIEFVQQALAYLNIAGECFIFLDREGGKGKLPRAMYAMRPDRVFIIPADRGLLGYVYVPNGKSVDEGIPILPEDMLHIKFPNPLDPLEGMGHGLSPISPLARSADVDNGITEFLKLFFDQSAIVPGILEFEQQIDESDVQRIKDRWREQYGGYENWAEVGVLDGGAKFNRIGLTFDEMAFPEIDRRNESRILGPFGVPPILIGSRVGLEHGTYANYKEARSACWEDTLIPESLLFEMEFLRLADPSSGQWLMFDLSSVPALQRDLGTLIEAAFKLWTMGVPANTALSTVGVDVEPTEFGDIPFVTTGVVSAENAIAPPQPPPPQLVPGGQQPPPDQQGDLPPGDPAVQMARQVLALLTGQRGDATRLMLPFPLGNIQRINPTKFTPIEKVWLWFKTNKEAADFEPEFADMAAVAFDEDRRALLALLHDEKNRSWQQKASIYWSNVEHSWDWYMREGESYAQWAEKFEPLLKGVMVNQGVNWSMALGIRFDGRQLDAEDWFQDYTLKFAQPIGQTTLDDIHVLFEQGLAEGWSINKVQANLGTLFDQYIYGDLTDDDFAWFNSRRPPHRTELIARTETMRASNAGSHRVFQRWGVSRKGWLAAHDDRTRKSHREAGAKYGPGGSVGPIPLDDFFVVGGSLLEYPGDPGAPIKETANCRCTVMPEVDDGWEAGYPPLPEDVPTTAIPKPVPSGPPPAGKPPIPPKPVTAPPPGENVPVVDGVRTPMNDQHAQKLTEAYDEWVKGLTSAEREALEWYTGSGYKEINRVARNQKDPSASRRQVSGLSEHQTMGEAVKSLDAALEDGRQFNTEPLKVWRGMNLEHFGFDAKSSTPPDLSTLIGTVQIDPGYPSTTVLLSQAQGWASARSIPGIVEITVPAGYAGAYVKEVSSYSRENEFLLPRGTRWQIVDAREVGISDLYNEAQVPNPYPSLNRGKINYIKVELLTD